MKQGSTLFLKGVVALIGIIVIGLCVFTLPSALIDEGYEAYRPLIVGMYVAAIPFFVALYQAMKLLSYIDKNKAFSNLSVNALRNVKYCAIAISALFAIGMPYIYLRAEVDDAPGVLALGLVITFASIVIATTAAVLQKLFQNAVDIKSENDLTV